MTGTVYTALSSYNTPLPRLKLTHLLHRHEQTDFKNSGTDFGDKCHKQISVTTPNLHVIADPLPHPPPPPSTLPSPTPPPTLPPPPLQAKTGKKVVYPATRPAGEGRHPDKAAQADRQQSGTRGGGAGSRLNPRLVSHCCCWSFPSQV